jgi:S1-C subfamily serine protease
MIIYSGCGTQVVEGSFASQAGLKVGDVILAISGIFGGMNNVLGKGIDEV